MFKSTLNGVHMLQKLRYVVSPPLNVYDLAT